MSLLVVAAVAASLLLTRNRQEKTPAVAAAGEHVPAEQALDAIRAAGL